MKKIKLYYKLRSNYFKLLFWLEKVFVSLIKYLEVIKEKIDKISYVGSVRWCSR